MHVGGTHRDLTRIWLFCACSQVELRKVQKVLDEVTVPAGTLLVEEGQPGLLFFVVLSGRASVRRRGRRIGALGPGEFFGELSLLDRGPRAASVTCDTEMTLLVIRQDDFERLLRASPSLTHRLLKTLAARLRTSEARAFH
jgi:CRP/FNR family transcriptional regulator, cyclic AMP receptor protein